MGNISAIDKAANRTKEIMAADTNIKQADAVRQAMTEGKIKETKFKSVSGKVAMSHRWHGRQVVDPDKVVDLDTTTNKKKIVNEPPPGSDAINYVEAFGMLETGSGPTDLLTDLKLTPTQLIHVIEMWNQIREKMWEKSTIPGAKYSEAWWYLAQTIGEKIREGCEWYEDTLGICRMWNFKDADSEMRSMFPGIFRVDGGKTRTKVGSHAEICAICHRGLAFKTGTPAA